MSSKSVISGVSAKSTKSNNTKGSTKSKNKAPGKTTLASTSAPPTTTTSIGLREMVLKKAVDKPEVGPETPNREVPPRIHEEVVISPTAQSEDIVSELSFGSGTASLRVPRQSILYTTAEQERIPMEMTTKVANDCLQHAKVALESAGNMKRECKKTALENLQALYEITLRLADSRSRHMNRLEVERARHARELLAVERAHTKERFEIDRHLVTNLTEAQRDVAESLKEARNIRLWLCHETEQPYREIGEIRKAVEVIDARISAECERASAHPGGIEKSKWDSLHRDVAKLTTGVSSISNQLDNLRRTLESIDSKASMVPAIQAITLSPPTNPPSLPDTPPKIIQHIQSTTPNTNSRLLENTLIGIQETLQEIVTANTIPPEPNQHPLWEDIIHIKEKLSHISTEIRSLKEKPESALSEPIANLGAELALESMRNTLEDIKQGINNSKAATNLQQPQSTFIKSVPPPNHTVIISSTDPQHTGTQVLEKIRSALDVKKTGVQVNRARTAKNQKVVLSCASKGDVVTVKKQMEDMGGLKVVEATTTLPLAVISDVMSFHSDAEIIEMIKMQNKHLLHGIDLKKETLRVRFRRRARNPLQCQPVLELSPPIWRRLTSVDKIYLDMQRVAIEDYSPLVQCTRCLGYGHTKAACKAEHQACSHCGLPHTWQECPARADRKPPRCINCVNTKREDTNHNAFGKECQERKKWDDIARSRVSYC